MFDLSILGNNIRALRTSQGWTQDELAKRAGYADKSMISRIEKGKVDLSQSQIVKFAEIFSIDAGALLRTNNESSMYYTNPETVKLAQELFDNPELRMLFDAAKNSKPEDLQMAADMLRRFKETNPNG